MSLAFIEFCKRVGIVAGAAAGVLFLVNIMAGFAWTTATRPIMDAIAAEAAARIEADEKLSAELSDIAVRQAMFVAAAISPKGSVERTRAEIYLRENALRVGGYRER